MKTEISMKTALYLRAAELIEAGWCQRAVSIEKDGKTSYCAVGAADRAQFELGMSYIPDQTIADSKVPGGDIVRWNNAPERTAAEVAALMYEMAFS